MMGDTHKLQGTVAGMVTAPLVCDSVYEGLGYVALTTFFALVPDIDHPNSTITKLGGPLTRSLSFLVRVVSKHRGLTHSALGIGLMGFGLWSLTHEPWIALGAVVGCLTHVAGDSVTRAGVYFWWPSKSVLRFAKIRTGGRVEGTIWWLTVAAGCLVSGLYVWKFLGLLS